MIHVTAEDVPLRLVHRFDGGLWVRTASTGTTIGIITRHRATSRDERSGWLWMAWTSHRQGTERTRAAACAELVKHYRAATLTPTQVRA